MLVVVVTVNGVAVALMHVVDVIVVRDGDMTATFTVGMLVGAMSGVRGCLALVVMTVMSLVQVALMHVVNVVKMRDGDVTTAFAMDVCVAGVFDVARRHELLLSYIKKGRDVGPDTRSSRML